MASKDGWAHEQNHNKIQLGTKNYRNMEEWSRPCATCGTKFSIFVRQNSTGINSNFGYRNCKDHRGMTRPATGAISAAENKEIETLKAELAEAIKLRDEYAEGVMDQMQANGNLRREMEVLKAKLAQYELSGALKEAQNNLPWAS